MRLVSAHLHMLNNRLVQFLACLCIGIDQAEQLLNRSIEALIYGRLINGNPFDSLVISLSVIGKNISPPWLRAADNYAGS